MLLNKIKYIINNLFGIDEFILDANTELIKDLQLDSLDMHKFKKELEYLFNIKLESVTNLFINYKTLGELTEYVQCKIDEIDGSKK